MSFTSGTSRCLEKSPCVVFLKRRCGESVWENREEQYGGPERTQLDDKPKVRIKLKAFVTDLRSGMDDRSLIQKHNLSETILPKVIEQLLAAGHISEEDLVNRNILDTTQKVADLFSFPFGSDDDELG